MDLKNIKPFESFSVNEKDWYAEPTEFEKLEQIDVYLGPMRKKLVLDIKGNTAEFSPEEIDELLSAITKAQSKM